jgi:DNA-binding beta-propeller fold protein YncE
MKMKRLLKICFSLVLLFGLIQFNSTANGQTVSLKKKWETPAQLKEPESVLFDKNANAIYVSNINNPAGGKDGNGSIGKVSVAGEIMEVEWVLGGMDAPKGLGLHNGLLYVADLTNVVVIDVKSGKVVNTIDVNDAGMLNDITVDEKGIVYISDSNKKRIYSLANNKAEVWLETDVFQRPNGLLAYKNKFYMVDMGSGIFYEINKKTKALTEIAKGLEGGDGIVPYGNDFIISIWGGEVSFVSAKGKVEKLLDTKAEKVNAADIDYIPELNLLLVPTFFANTVAAYEIVK